MIAMISIAMRFLRPVLRAVMIGAHADNSPSTKYENSPAKHICLKKNLLFFRILLNGYSSGDFKKQEGRTEAQ